MENGISPGGSPSHFTIACESSVISNGKNILIIANITNSLIQAPNDEMKSTHIDTIYCRGADWWIKEEEVKSSLEDKYKLKTVPVVCVR